MSQPPNSSPLAPTSDARPPKPKRRRGGCGCLALQVIVIVVGVTLAVGLGVAVVAGLVVVGDLTDRLEAGLERLEQYDARQAFQTTRIYDRNGMPLYEIFEEGRRTRVALADIPQHMIDATIATEDDTFWDNTGVDLPSILRAAAQWITKGEIVSGGSTITQQLVRLIAFDYEYRAEQSLQRKLEEAILAMLLNERKTKSEVLELYLNAIYYGNLVYGVEAAAQVYFGKPARELTLAQATLLAGLPQSPAELDPLSPDEDTRRAVKRRQRTVLNLMVAHGYLSQAQADTAYDEPLVLMNPNVPLNAPHFTVYAQKELETLLSAIGQDPELIQSGGLQVFTSLDLRYQALAEQVARAQVTAMRDAHNMTNAAVVVTHPPTGEILAMVGSADYWDDNIDGRVNVAIQPRQPGSAIKPLTYATALEQGWTAADVLWDTPTHIGTGAGTYIPLNYDRRFHGPVRLRDALANSYNVPAVQTLRQAGVENLLAMASRLGIRSLGLDASHYGLSLTLGGGEVTPLELTQAFAVFANEGNLVPVVSVLCVLDSDGNMLYQYAGRCPRGVGTPTTVNAVARHYPVLDPRIAFVISDILADNAARTPAMGADSPLNTGSSVPASVKTGTSDDWRDNWTVGYTRNLAVGVWAGNSDGSPMTNISGLQGAAPIWHDVMLGVYGNQDLLAVLARDGHLTPDYRQPPPGMSRREVCRLSSLQDPATECPRTAVEWFLDSPAALPNLEGALVAPAPTPSPNTAENPNAPMVTEVSYGVWVATVMALPPELQPALAPQPTSDATMPPPRYCVMPASWQDRPEAVPYVQQLWFIEPPPVREDEIRARAWAQDHNIPVLPYLLCDDALLAHLGGGAAEGLDAVWRIADPTPGEEVSGVVPIIGTAQFRPDQVQFYKIEIGQGTNPIQWATLGETHSQPVINNVLEYLHADALPPGDWVICLELVKLDGNFPTPYCVPINIVR